MWKCSEPDNAHNVLLCILCTHLSVHIIHRTIIPAYNVHPHSSVKNLGKKCTPYMAKYSK